MTRVLKNSGNAQESANPSSCTYVLDHKGKSVGSELIGTPQRERTIVGQSSLGSARLQRWFSWAEAWKGSPHPLANEMLTVLLPRAELDDWIARGGTIGSYRKRILDEVRRPIATHGYPWLAMYVTEVRNTPHFHALLWLPLATTIREEVAKWFIRRFGCRLKDRASSYFESLRPWRREVSTPVEFTAVTEARRRAGTELYGFDGAAHYLAKAIEKNSQRQCGRPLGKLIGCSSELIVDHRFKRQSAAT